jgi:hypothetical protein
MSALDLLSRWESRRTELARLRAQVDGAALVEEFITDLEAIVGDEQPVTLTRAAAVTGYSADHLSRLIKTGKLKDHGRKHAPRVRVSECPRKAAVATGDSGAYDPGTDALSLVGSRR